VDKVHISNERSYNTFETSATETLQNTCGEKGIEILSGGRDNDADNDDPGRDDEDASFTPNTGKDNNQRTSTSDCEKLISG